MGSRCASIGPERHAWPRTTCRSSRAPDTVEPFGLTRHGATPCRYPDTPSAGQSSSYGNLGNSRYTRVRPPVASSLLPPLPHEDAKLTKLKLKMKMLRSPVVETPLGEATRRAAHRDRRHTELGNGQAMKTALELRDALTTRGYRTALEMFSDLESLHEWSQKDDVSSPPVICVGGDGTQSATAAAAVRRSVPFLSVSHGFGNLFARAFHHRSARRALDLLMYGRVIPSDLGARNGELFLCQQSYGLISEVQEAVEGGGAAPRTRWQRWLVLLSRRPSTIFGKRLRRGCVSSWTVASLPSTRLSSSWPTCRRTARGFL